MDHRDVATPRSDSSNRVSLKLNPARQYLGRRPDLSSTMSNDLARLIDAEAELDDEDDESFDENEEGEERAPRERNAVDDSSEEEEEDDEEEERKVRLG